jgi:hypothetical protein
MVIQTELVQSGSLKSDTRLDLGESELSLLSPPTYWLFRTNQTLRLVSWSTKTLHHQPIGQRMTSPFLDLFLGIKFKTGRYRLAQPILNKLLGVKFKT